MQACVNGPINPRHVAVFSDAELLQGMSQWGNPTRLDQTHGRRSPGMSKSKHTRRHSSTESEIVALDIALRSEGMLVLGLWPQHLAATLQGQSAADWPATGPNQPLMVVFEGTTRW